jgi:hypothetical protein
MLDFYCTEFTVWLVIVPIQNEKNYFFAYQAYCQQKRIKKLPPFWDGSLKILTCGFLAFTG